MKQYKIVVADSDGWIAVNLNVEAQTSQDALLEAAHLTIHGIFKNSTPTQTAEDILAKAEAK